MDYSLLQEHTLNIYQLTEHECVIYQVEARSLLRSQRFDLFAKLYYIGNRDSNRESAIDVYSAHIKAFNPDGKEPGRNDKNDIMDFLSSFDALIEQFRIAEFDDSISIVPVDKKGVILDGAHRVAALAFFNKRITIAQYLDVESKCDFDYQYFLDRGLAWSICDTIALEMNRWFRNNSLLVACLWPRLGNKAKNDALKQISFQHEVAYLKRINVNLKSLTRFVQEIYKEQSWTTNHVAVQDKAIRIYGNDSRSIWFVFFENNEPLEVIIKEKEQIRELTGFAKDSLHMTDNSEETRQIANLVLTKEGLSNWMGESHMGKSRQAVVEKWHFFKNVTWLGLKSKIWRIIHPN